MLIVAFSKHPRQGDLIELTTKRLNFPRALITRITKASSKGIYTMLALSRTFKCYSKMFAKLNFFAFS